MKTKNILRIFLCTMFVLGSIAVQSQTKIYVNKSNGIPVEFNIADIDSISFNPDIRSLSVELTSPITENTTLRDLGLPVDYIFNGSILYVQNNAVLTIEPGVTIQFRKSSGELYIQDGASLKAMGTADKHIQFTGPVDDKGSWYGIFIRTARTSDELKNELNYTEILNAGGGSPSGLNTALQVEGTVDINNCLISGSATNGIELYDVGDGGTVLTSFSNNTISDCNNAPIRTDYYAGTNALRNMDNTNTFTGNAEAYIHIANSQYGGGEVTVGNMTLPNLKGYPWYFENYLWLAGDQNFTVEAGAVLIMGSHCRIEVPINSHFIADGTAQAHITIKGLRSEAGYWDGIHIYSQTVGTKLNYCDISDGGGEENSYMSNIYLYSGNGGGSANSYLEMNNTTVSNSQRYGIHCHDYDARYSRATIISSNPASVTFSGCQLGNIYSDCDNRRYAIYPDLSSSCNLGY